MQEKDAQFHAGNLPKDYALAFRLKALCKDQRRLCIVQSESNLSGLNESMSPQSLQRFWQFL